ncbi:MAG: hypothetical protein MRY74_15075 [Neomegalonema sp.]|nr:hypothetical protein [Neomegalonema sp.]
MSGSDLQTDFSGASSGGRKTAKHPAPFSIRLTEDERAYLRREAGTLSISAHIRAKLFQSAPLPERPTRKRRTPSANQAELAKLLGGLGGSRLSSNMNQIAKAAHIGALPVTPELEQELAEACADIKRMRSALILALGVADQDAAP